MCKSEKRLTYLGNLPFHNLNSFTTQNSARYPFRTIRWISFPTNRQQVDLRVAIIVLGRIIGFPSSKSIMLSRVSTGDINMTWEAGCFLRDAAQQRATNYRCFTRFFQSARILSIMEEISTPLELYSALLG